MTTISLSWRLWRLFGGRKIDMSGLKRSSYRAVLGGFLCLFGVTQHAGATNYFSWGVEGSKLNYGVNGPGTFNVTYHRGTSQDCTQAHSGSCSMKLVVIGNDSGNQQMGIDTQQWNPTYPWPLVGSPPLYYRWWMRIMPGFSWGSVTYKTKASRTVGITYPRAYTGYVYANGFNLGECDDVGAGLPGGGCVDPGPFIYYNVAAKNDGFWHEYIIMVKPNSTFSTADAQFLAYVDGQMVGQQLCFILHDKSGNMFTDAWGGWMVSPYFQLNGSVNDGGTIYLDDFSTDDTWNSIFPANTGPPAAPYQLPVK